MTPFLVFGLYLSAGVVPAYFVARNARSIWSNLAAWLAGFLVELGTVVGMLIVVFSINPEAAPLAIAMTIVPPLSLLLITPCAGVGVAQARHYIERLRSHALRSSERRGE
jgi:heme A synthase